MVQLGPRNKPLTPLATKKQASQTIPTTCPKMMITITVMVMPAMGMPMPVTEMPLVTEMPAVMEMAAVTEMAVASTGVATEAVGVVTAAVMAAVAEENESSL